jgi:predicted MFS family arabinose efflux permease
VKPSLVALFAVACGLCVANLYYAQPLIAHIAAELGLHPGLAGVIVSVTQLGFGAGLLLIVPLSDLLENRRLVALTLSGVAVGLVGIAASGSASQFLIASFVLGVGAVAAQVLLPFASQLAAPQSRGSVVGIIMGGLVGGIMLARPISSYLASELGWRAVFGISACAMIVLIAVLMRVLPRRQPAANLTYREILQSLPKLLRATPVLRRRAFYQGMVFASFNLFWTASPLLLIREYSLGHKGIALFTLAAAAGALASPLAGRFADRGLTRTGTRIALATGVVAFAVSAVSDRAHSLALLAAAAVLLDAATQVNQVLGLRTIYMLPSELRGRLNGLYMTFIFMCGAVGSALSAAIYLFSGWIGLSIVGALLCAIALLVHSSEQPDSFRS